MDTYCQDEESSQCGLPSPAAAAAAVHLSRMCDQCDCDCDCDWGSALHSPLPIRRMPSKSSSCSTAPPPASAPGPAPALSPAACCPALINEMTVCILQAAPAGVLTGRKMRSRRTKEMPSKIHESQQKLPCCRKWPTASGSNNSAHRGRGSQGARGTGKFRTVKSFVAARALESFAEIQINKMQHENCKLQVATGECCG